PEPRRTATRASALTLPFLPATRAEVFSAAEAVRQAGPRTGEERIQLYQIGLLLARATDAAGVEAQAAALERTTDEDGTSTGTDLALAVRAHLAAWEGRPADALRLLEKMDLQAPYGAKGWQSGLPERMLRARVLRDLGRYAEALRWASTVDATLGEQIIWFAPALLLQGELQELLGAREEAAAAYARVIELWKECDPELRPQLVKARQKLEAVRVATGKEARHSD
ncbi:MAG TPA: hypothetical protein VKH65_15230, partial [Myxococcales bacterium]|nr:hypothetical protein [Myxococcales bacterium]